ncbi:MAG TPA: pathogenicity locus [Actinobacteria bacterium]|nr:pathogenicity locus [Actinomycetota bacterium]
MNSTKDLQTIPGVGKNIAQDLVDIGIKEVVDLKNVDPETLYESLCVLRGQHVDRCVLYVFRCAVYFASEKQHDPDLLKWWNWKDAKRG